MGRFVDSQQTKTVRADWWDEDEYVVIRKYTVGAKDRMNAEMVRIAGMAGQVPEVVVQAATVPVLVAGIKEWNLCDNEGKPVPCTRQWISQLEPDDADFIADEIRAFNASRSDEEAQRFFRGLAGGDSEQGDAPA